MKYYTLILLFGFIINSACSQTLEDSDLRPSSNTPTVEHSYYELEYSEQHEQALWVYYTLTAANINGTAKRKNNFKNDPLVTTKSASTKDYTGSGYDRGHLCPAASMTLSDSNG